MNIVVIGSGLGGLSAAIRLQAKGHRVTIFEKRDKPGGRAYVYEQDGFTFDGGPTIITAPQLIKDLFSICGKQMEDYVQIIPLDPFYNIRFEDGTLFHYNADREQLLRQIRALNPEDCAGYLQFAKLSEQMYTTGFQFIDHPFTHLSDMTKILPDLQRLQAWKSVAGIVNHYIKDERLRQVFSFHPLLIGGNPFQSTSIYTLIHTLEQRFGVWYAIGGMGALVKALVQIFEEMGGTLILDTEVSEILIDERCKRATGVRLKQHNTAVSAQIVVSNADVAYTYLNLFPSFPKLKRLQKRMRNISYAMSLFVIYFGTKRKYEHMGHHEILMGPRYKGLLEDVFTRKILAKDFSLYLHRPTATDPSLAPPGCDCWYVLSPVPNLSGSTDWRTAARPYRNLIMNYLVEHYLPNLSNQLMTEHTIDPPHFQRTLNSYLGSAFSVEPILTQSAWFRPHNISEAIANLYLVGAGTHPGAGVPGVLSSGKIVADMIAAQ
jgi:phytoene desaturase